MVPSQKQKEIKKTQKNKKENKTKKKKQKQKTNKRKTKTKKDLKPPLQYNVKLQVLKKSVSSSFNSLQ